MWKCKECGSPHIYVEGSYRCPHIDKDGNVLITKFDKLTIHEFFCLECYFLEYDIAKFADWVDDINEAGL